jgi:mannosyl-3-phosphoglycerate phosphatase family protein
MVCSPDHKKYDGKVLYATSYGIIYISMKQVLIFTDLDGTLLDYSDYSFERALPALEIIERREIPLIICTSKTQTEIEHYRRRLNNRHPFISENGGGVFIPKDYGELQIANYKFKTEEESDYYIIRLGARYDDLRTAIKSLQQEGFDVKGFGDMSIEEVADITGLSKEEAAMAKERDFDEPFIFSGSECKTRTLLQRINEKGFHYTQGIYFHILGNSDKGKAVSILADMYKNALSDIVTVAIGDSLNDVPMLERVDYPVVVQKPDGSYDPRISLPDLIKAPGSGPAGWNKAVIEIIKMIEDVIP